MYKCVIYLGLSLIGLVSPLLADSINAEESPRYKIIVENLTDYDLSPGGYVIHGKDFALYELGELASPAVVSLCETGKTADFLFYTRHAPDAQSIRNAFSFDGGVPARKKAEIIFHATPEYPYISLLHKVSFTDDTCAGAHRISLFNEAGMPIGATFTAYGIDAGVLENIKTAPPKDSLLGRLNWSYWKQEASRPAQPISESLLFGKTPLAQITIIPMPPDP